MAEYEEAKRVRQLQLERKERVLANFNLGLIKAVREEGIKQELLRDLEETEKAAARAAAEAEEAKVEVEKLTSGRPSRQKGKDLGQGKARRSCSKGKDGLGASFNSHGSHAEKPGSKGSAARTPTRAAAKSFTVRLSHGKKKKGGRKHAAKAAQPTSEEDLDAWFEGANELTKDQKEERERLYAKLMRERTIARARDQVKQQTEFVATTQDTVLKEAHMTQDEILEGQLDRYQEAHKSATSSAGARVHVAKKVHSKSPPRKA